MLRMLSLPPEIQQRLRHADVSLPYDSVIRLARMADLMAQRKMVDLVLSGTQNTELRRRIGDLNQRSRTNHRKKKTERVSVSVNGYTATVSGPPGKDAYQLMNAAVAELRDQLDRGEINHAA